MEHWIDIHSHILPNLDDGASSLEQSLEMARQAVKEGIHTIIATPHHGNGIYWNPTDTILKAVEKINKLLIDNGICLQIAPGQEVRFYRTLVDDFAQHANLTLNDSRYILLELPQAEIPKELDETIYELRMLGLVPIIAHPERNWEFLDHPQRLSLIVSQGALIQLTSHSITGLFGRKIQKFSLHLCQNKLAHFIASDAHEPYYRSIGLEAAYRIVRTTVNSEYADGLQENARRVLTDEPIEPWIPAEKRNKWYHLFRKNNSTTIGG